jgi:hypothetical protein
MAITEPTTKMAQKTARLKTRLTTLSMSERGVLTMKVHFLPAMLSGSMAISAGGKFWPASV